jgi:DNA-binding CsgD family transcriptional regulator
LRRSSLTEKQKSVALLIALGELTYIEIARLLDINRNTVTNLTKNAQVQALVTEFQQGIQDKMESQTLRSIQHKNALLLPKALEKLEAMLDSRSQKKQMQVIKFLLSYGARPGGSDAPLDPVQEGQSHLQLSPEARAWLKAH